MNEPKLEFSVDEIYNYIFDNIDYSIFWEQFENYFYLFIEHIKNLERILKNSNLELASSYFDRAFAQYEDYLREISEDIYNFYKILLDIDSSKAEKEGFRFIEKKIMYIEHKYFFSLFASIFKENDNYIFPAECSKELQRRLGSASKSQSQAKQSKTKNKNFFKFYKKIARLDEKNSNRKRGAKLTINEIVKKVLEEYISQKLPKEMSEAKKDDIRVKYAGLASSYSTYKSKNPRWYEDTNSIKIP